MGAFVEGEFRLFINGIVSKPIYCHFHLFRFSLFILSLCFQKLVEGQCPSLVTRRDNAIKKNFTEMRRMTHDQTPYLLVLKRRATTLDW
jgi:hypothetical protein